MTTSKAEIRRMLRAAFKRTAVVGDEIYFPARWAYGDRAGTASTSCHARRHARTYRHARMAVAADRVADRMGLYGFHLDDDDESTVEAVVALLHRMEADGE